MTYQPEITSLHNTRIKQALKLWERKERDALALFLVEGYREIERAYGAHWPLDTLFICPPLFLGTNEPALIENLRAKKVTIISCSESVFRKLSYRDRPDGLLAIAKQKQRTLEQFDFSLASTIPLFIIAESIEKPGNLGTILRSADAAGVHGLIVADPCTDIFNPNVVRASVGTLFTVPIVQTTSDKALDWLKCHAISILAATPHATVNFTEADLTKPLAIAMGTEQFGLSKQWMNHAHLQVRIPMHGSADSLNVAMATTLMLYETLRQRQS